jgi:hypothetical protein
VVRVALILAVLSAAISGCGGSSSAPTSPPLHRAAPRFGDFLHLPVATPSACPSTENGTTIGRESPWVGTVDVSTFLRPSATPQQIRALGAQLRGEPLVQKVYFESARQAYHEFQRLYTCWTSVPRDQTPASYRLVLVPTATLASRNALVRRLAGQPPVDTVSCDPTVPCVNALPSASASISP